MIANTEQRKLAAIMFTDMTGYPDASEAQLNEGLPPSRASVLYK